MINIQNFNNCDFSGIAYGGHSGSKKGIIIDNERWFLKYPKSTKSMQVENISYTTTPVSEYLASHIYKSLGIDTHETRLGIANGKTVVACKDFLENSEMIFDYNSIKNNYDEAIENISISSSFTSNDDIEEVLLNLEKNYYFNLIPAIKTRFWDMFIVDAFISNNDRNEGNWGLIYNRDTKKLRLVPVFDNGAAFYNKSDDTKLEELCNDTVKFEQVAYHSCISIFNENSKHINPLKYIESMKNKDCNDALIRVFKRIDFNVINKIFNEVPEEYDGITILSEIQKNFYLKVLKYRYEKVFLPIYNKLINN